MPSYTELRKTNHFYYFIKFTLNVYSMLFSVSFGKYTKRSTPGAIVSASEQERLLVEVDATPIASQPLANPPFGTFRRIIHLNKEKCSNVKEKDTSAFENL